MRKLVYTPRADVDLREIWHFSANRWNVDQADTYVRQLLDTCGALAQGTLIGREADVIQEGYRKQPAGSHVVYFQNTPEEIVIVRILQKRMDALSHLDEQ